MLITLFCLKFVDIEKLGADFGFTLDSGDVGHFEYENFSANAAKLKIKGVSAHPGYAKGKMEHASKIAAEILSGLPKDTLSPETTEGKEGFIHPNKIEGMLEEASIEFIVNGRQLGVAFRNVIFGSEDIYPTVAIEGPFGQVQLLDHTEDLQRYVRCHLVSDS